MNTLKPTTKSVVGPDRATIWILWSGLALVVIAIGIGVVALFADLATGIGRLSWWIATGGSLLCALGGWRATRRWSSFGRHKNPGEME